MAKSGSETIGAPGDKSKMTLFKDDRAEDIGAIIMSVLVIATIMVLTMNKPPAQPAAPAAPAATTAAPASSPMAPSAPAKK
jgi:flagellar basal body L-ring protein FlgH